MSVQQVKFKEIADAIREKTNGTDKIKPSEFAGKVDEVYEAGKAKGIEEGKKSEYDRFWEDTLKNMGLGDFAFAGPTWTDESFNPPRGTVIQPSRAVYMFACARITDLVALCEEKEITIDFSKSTSFMDTFYGAYGANFTRIGVVNTTSSNSLNQTFYGQLKLHTIVKIILRDDGSQTFPSAFNNCSALENVEFEGTIGQNMDVHWSTKLTHDSLMSILNAGRNCTLNLGTANLEKLSVEEKAIATIEKGCTLI